ncbi:hypothetical protein PFISCL1PPCAC_10839, partial [Pristionchus fissidentatus]
SMIYSNTVILAIVAGFALADYCPQSINAQIQACVQPVGEYAKMLNNNQDSPSSEFSPFSLPNMGKKVFFDLCKLVNKFNDCVKDLRRTCPRHVTIGLIDSSYGYLCNDGYHTFLDSAECLMDLDRKPEVKKCHDRTLREIERANGEPNLELNEKVDRMCSALNFFSGCVKQPIRNDCGQSAWQVIHRVLKDTTKTLMPGCVFGRTTTMASIKEGEEKSVPLSHHSPDHSESRHSEIRSHGTRAGRKKTTTTTEPTSTGSDFIVGTSEDDILREHLKESKLISTESSSDYYQLPVSSSSHYLSLFYLLVLVALRLR